MNTTIVNPNNQNAPRDVNQTEWNRSSELGREWQRFARDERERTNRERMKILEKHGPPQQFD